MRGTAMVILALLSAGMAAGCVERELTITSNPSGALVSVSDVEVGRTPLTIPFTWYGNYEIILRMDDVERDGQIIRYETLKTHSHILPPWYDIPPWDLASQALVPWTYRYHVHRHYELKPMELPSDEKLLENAHQLQQRNLEPVRR